MADEDVHRSKCPLKLPGLVEDVGERTRLRRFSMPRLIHRITIETGGGERLAETKEILLRAGCAMGEQRDRMRARRRGGKSKRGRVRGQHYLFDANARLDHAR